MHNRQHIDAIVTFERDFDEGQTEDDIAILNKT